MKKILTIAALLTLPVMVYAADQDTTTDDQALVAASYQQGEAADPAAPVTKPVEAPALDSKTPAAPVATSPASPDAAPKAPEEPSPLAKNVDDLNNKVITLQSQLNQLQQQGDQLQQQTAQLQYSVYGLSALIILLALLLLVRRNKKARQAKISAAIGAASGSAKTIKIEDDTQSEYDFMGSSEGIPAKLDLARAYIAMEDFTAARETLAEILGEGSEEHRLEAKELLNKINS